MKKTPANPGKTEAPRNADAEAAADGRGFEELMDEAEGIAEKLESGELTLDESLRLYETGVSLLRRGSGVLAQTEKRLRRLIEDAGGFHLEEVEDPGENGNDGNGEDS